MHELVDADALHGVAILTRIKPAGVQVVLSSRHDPPLSLPGCASKGRLWELRAAQLRFTPDQAATLMAASGLHLSPPQVEVLHRRTGGWVAGLRLAALGVGESADREAFLARFSGDDHPVANYLVGEVLSGLPEDVQEFLRVISICDPVPNGLAAQLSGREDAASLLDRLGHQTSLVAATGPRRAEYLIPDLNRQGPRRVADLQAATARWWAGQGQPVRALEHAAQSQDEALVTDLLRRLAVPLTTSSRTAAGR